MQIKNTDILNRLAEVKTLRANVRKDVTEVQALCKHEDVGEASGEYSSWNEGYDPTERVCLQCGLTEKSKYGNWKVLPNPLVYKLTMRQLREITIDADRI